MRRLAFLLIGGASAYAAWAGMLHFFAPWYEARFVKSDDDIGVAYVWSLAVLLGLVCAGMYAGNKLFQKIRSADENRRAQR